MTLMNQYSMKRKDTMEGPENVDADILAFVDESGERGFVRKLSAVQDHLISVLCALPIPAEYVDELREELRPLYDRFKDSAPEGAKIHIVDAFKPGNESWRIIAEQVRDELFSKMREMRIILIYAARRCRLAREIHEMTEVNRENSKENRRSPVKLVGENRPSDDKIEDNVMQSLALMLDAFAEQEGGMRVDILFDEIDAEIAKRYGAELDATRNIEENVTTVRGWDPRTEEKVEGEISISANAPFRLDSKYLGTITVVGKDDPLIFAVDVVANSLWRHLSTLSNSANLNDGASVSGWHLENLVWAKDEEKNLDLI